MDEQTTSDDDHKPFVSLCEFSFIGENRQNRVICCVGNINWLPRKSDLTPLNFSNMLDGSVPSGGQF